MRPIVFVCVLVVFLAAGCKNEKDFFEKGKKVKSGFVWERSPIKADEILAGKSVKPVCEENFERAEFGEKWQIQGGEWKIENGWAFSPKAENRNLVFKGCPLPEKSVVEMDLRSETDFVDIKFNLYGDGGIHDHGDGYSFIMGGWKNQMSVLTKLHEHEENRVEERETRWKQSTVYHVKVIKLSKKIYWFVNDEIFLARFDDAPLSPANDYKYLSLANWRSLVYFDNIRVSSIE